MKDADALPYGARLSLRGLLRGYLAHTGTQRGEGWVPLLDCAGVGEAVLVAGWLIATRYGLARPPPEDTWSLQRTIWQRAATLGASDFSLHPAVAPLVQVAAEHHALSFDGPPRPTVLRGRSALVRANHPDIHTALRALNAAQRQGLGYDRRQRDNLYWVFEELPAPDDEALAARLLRHTCRAAPIALTPVDANSAMRLLSALLAGRDGAAPRPEAAAWCALFGHDSRFFAICGDPERPWSTPRGLSAPGYIGSISGVIGLGGGLVGQQLRHRGGMAD